MQDDETTTGPAGIGAGRPFMQDKTGPRSVTLQKRWVFESRASLEEFEARLRTVLEARGFDVDDATVFDVAARADGFRVFFGLRYHHRGIQAVVKVKGGLLSSAEPMVDRAFEAIRRTQLDLAGTASGEERGDGPDDRTARHGAEDVTRVEGDRPEQERDRQQDRGEERPRQDLDRRGGQEDRRAGQQER